MPEDAFAFYFPESNRDEIVYRSGEIGQVGHCRSCGCMVIQGQWRNHVEWHRELAEED